MDLDWAEVESFEHVRHVELAGEGEGGTVCDQNTVVFDAHSEEVRAFLCDDLLAN